MRILFLTSVYSTPRLPARGIPNARIARAMKRFADVRVVAPVPFYPRAIASRHPELRSLVDLPRVEKDEDGDDVLHPRYVHVPRVGRAWYPWLYAGSLVGELAAEVARFRPDVVLSAWAFPDGVASVALAHHFGVPCVMRVMGSDVNTFAREPWRRPQIRWALEQADRVVAVSSALRDACLELFASPASASHVDVIPTGIDPLLFRPLDRTAARTDLLLRADRRTVIVPARLAPEKGLLTFVDAFARLPEDVDAILLGEGPLEGEIRARISQVGLGHRVRMAGRIPESRMPLYYAAADLVCLPSTEEGWPNVLLESFACGCPWVASRVGGVPEIAQIADGAVLCRPNDPVDLARALSVGLSRGFDRAAIATRAAGMSLDATVQGYLDSVTRALARWKPAKAPARRETLAFGSPLV